MYVYVLNDLNKQYGNNIIFKGISLSFLPNAKIGIIGRNGAGKSTLLKIMAGVDKEFDGEAYPMSGIKVGYLSQEPVLDETKTVYENIKTAFEYKVNLLQEYNDLSMKFAEEMSDDEMQALIEKQTQLQDKIEACGAWDIEREIEVAMDALRCPDADANITEISGGERRRVAICKLLLEKPDILLLDEPTNHLDAESVAWLERYLHEYAGMVVMVTHDRYFLDNVTDWILEIDQGRGIPWKGNYASWLRQKEQVMAREEKSENHRSKHLAKELEWIKQSSRATKSKSRLNSYNELLSQERNLSGKGLASITIPNGDRLGDKVIEINDLSKGHDDQLLIENFNFLVTPASIVGIVGANGSGKTTLFNMITGQEKPDKGEIILGQTVKLSHVDQHRHNLNDAMTVWEAISGGNDEIMLGKSMVNSRAYCSTFNFKGSDQQKVIGDLSGGERNRVHLAKMLRAGGNVLLLDEPTNDLDVETLRSLEDAINEFAGCVLVISHDRWFLDRIATHIISFEGNSKVEWFAGNYSAYEEDKIRRLGKDALIPTKIKYKKFLRTA